MCILRQVSKKQCTGSYRAGEQREVGFKCKSTWFPATLMGLLSHSSMVLFISSKLPGPSYTAHPHRPWAGSICTTPWPSRPLPGPALAVVNLSKAAAAWDRQSACVFYSKCFGESMREFWIHKLPRHLFYQVAHFLSCPISHLSRNKLNCSSTVWPCFTLN